MSLLIIVIPSVSRRRVCGRLVGALPNASLASRHVCTPPGLKPADNNEGAVVKRLPNNKIIFIYYTYEGNVKLPAIKKACSHGKFNLGLKF